MPKSDLSLALKNVSTTSHYLHFQVFTEQHMTWVLSG